MRLCIFCLVISIVFVMTGCGGSSGGGGGTPGGDETPPIAFFQMDDSQHGTELGITDGTEIGTYLVKDIREGGDGCSLTLDDEAYFAVLDNILYFRASDGTNGRELWRSDGTEAGTYMVKDIEPGSDGSDVEWLVAAGGKLYFQADTSASGRELWVSDGTETGTQLVEDINPGSSNHSRPSHITAFGDKVVFGANNGSDGMELWISDGTAAGTYMVKDIYPGVEPAPTGPPALKDPGQPYGSSPEKFVVMGTDVYFAANSADDQELWKSDGTADGTVQVANLSSTGGSFPRHLCALGSTLFFAATNSDGGGEGKAPDTGLELYKTSGLGVTLVRDINSGTSDSGPKFMTVVNGKCYFVADNGTDGEELWVSDGTLGGTNMVKDINDSGSSQPIYLTVVNDKLFFRANDGTNGPELWVSDGTSVGTQMVKNITPSLDDSIKCIYPLGTKGIVFGANDGVNGVEPWFSDGTADGTYMIKNCWPGNQSGFSGTWHLAP